MNDELREKLSAYLDGALSDMDRRDVEERLAASEEMRRELEALRSVSAAVKGLPEAELPAGFRARLEARIARGEKPAREYFILPPAMRPVAFALSSAVVALLVWDRARGPIGPAALDSGWDGAPKVAFKSASEAPPSVDVSGRLSALSARARADGGGAGAAAEADIATNGLQGARKNKQEKEDAPAAPASVASTFGKHLSAPGKPYGAMEEAPAKASAPAAPPAAADKLESLDEAGGSMVARSEEERSAINERLYKNFEDEKKRMGIASIIDKDAPELKAPAGGRQLMARQARQVASVRGAGAAKAAAKTTAPEFKALALKSAEALQAAWAAAGLPGEPPAVNFPKEMALFLAGPEGCGIVSVEDRKKFLVALYKSDGLDPASRVKAVPSSSKPAVVKLAP